MKRIIAILLIIVMSLSFISCGKDNNDTESNNNGTNNVANSNNQADNTNDQANDADDQTNDGNDQTNDGNDQTNDGNDQTNDGNDQTNDGNDQTNDGNDQTNDGNDQTNDGNDQTNDGNDQTNDGNDQTNDGNDQTNDGNDQTNDGSGNDDSTSGGNVHITDINTDYSLDEYVVFDTELYKITFNSLEEDGYGDFDLKVVFENKTENKLLFSMDSVAINSYMVDSRTETIIEGNRKIAKSMKISSEELREANILSIDELMFLLRVADQTEENRSIYFDYVNVYPTGLSRDTVRYPMRGHREGEKRSDIVTTEEFELVCLDRKFDSDGNYQIKFYIRNWAAGNCTYRINDVFIEDYSLNTFFAESVNPNCRTIATATVRKEDIERLGVENADFMSIIFIATRTFDFSQEPFYYQLHEFQ